MARLFPNHVVFVLIVFFISDIYTLQDVRHIFFLEKVFNNSFNFYIAIYELQTPTTKMYKLRPLFSIESTFELDPALFFITSIHNLLDYPNVDAFQPHDEMQQGGLRVHSAAVRIWICSTQTKWL